ncbi:SDR family oxidoreductase [Streptomyces sp. NPDC005012]|uniref:SDR family oxidoreductase n=1 Tax=Streptomyces sp. NPDC005012 TaxID=3154558 RepID=UPI0033AB5980
MSRGGPARPPEHAAVAVVGMGLRLPGAGDAPAFWTLLNRPGHPFSPPGERYRQTDFFREGREEPDRTYSPVAGFLHDDVDSAGDPHEVRWLRQCARQATARVRSRHSDRPVCVVGAWPGGSQSLLHTVMSDLVVQEWAATAGATPPDEDSLRTALASAFPQARAGAPEAAEAVHAALSGILPRDPTVITVDTACSSSLYALDIGAKLLRSGRADLALCGGVSVLEPTMSVLFSAIGGLSASGRLLALDAEADGTLFSDAAVLLTLKNLDRARADGDPVLAVLAGFGAAADGRGRSIAAPNPSGQIRAVRRAREERGLAPDDIDWIVAHATGTTAGDAAEIEALGEDAPEAGWQCTATKSLIGHAGWAAGAASVAHVLLALRHGRIPAQPGMRQASRPLRGLEVPTTARDWSARPGRPRIAGVSAFGFGGTNGHLLLGDPWPGSPAAPPTAPESCTDARESGTDALVLVAWSARLPGSSSTDAVRAWLAGTGPAPGRRFDLDKEPPSFAAVGLPAPTVRAIDRAQTLALETAHRFAEEHGPIWEPVRDRTAVLAARSGVPSALVHYALRAHADALTRAVRDHPGGQAAAGRLLDRARAAVPPAGPDAMPGVLPNVIPSRLTARYDLRGASICLDTGRTSAATALDTAAAYLATGETELALVLALDAGSQHTGPRGCAPAAREGAFLLALAQESTARRHEWPVLARLTTASAVGRPAGEGSPTGHPVGVAVTASASPGREFHAAAGAVELLTRLATADPSTTPTLALPFPGAASPGQRDHLTVRHVTRHRAAPWTDSGSGSVPALPDRALLLGDDAHSAARLRRLADQADAILLCTDPQAPPDLRPGSEADLRDAVDRAAGHLRVLAHPRPWPKAPGRAASDLQELLLRALARTRTGAVGGSLGVTVLGPAEHPQAALFTALVPALRADHPDLPLRVVASGTDDPGTAWERLAREWRSCDESAAVWYHDGRRHVHELVPRPLPPVRDTGDDAGGQVVVASGGAGGVTTALLTALVESRDVEALWLLGTTDPDRLQPEVLNTPDDQLPALRADLIARHLRSGGLRVADAARLADRDLAGRRAALNLARLREAAGSTAVHYVVCDITDPAAVDAAARRVRSCHDRVDLFLHAATRSRTAPLERKTLEDFRLVRDVKITGYHLLRDAFTRPRPRLWCNVASVAAVHPLRGEIDYGPANAYLAAAADLPGTTGEITLGFPLWRESGYFAAQPALADRLTAHGRLTAVGDAEGVAHFLGEMGPDRAGPGSSVYLGARELGLLRAELPGAVADGEEDGGADADRASRGAREVRSTGASTGRTSGRPVFLSGDVRSGPAGDAWWALDLDGPEHGYLGHHLVRGRPAVPGTFLLAAATEAALALHPGSTPARIVDASFEAFVRPSQGPARRAYTLRARTDGGAGPTTVSVTVHGGTAATAGHSGREHRCFAARVVLDDQLSEECVPPLSGPVRPLPPDPYYYPDSPVRLTGPFVNTWRWRDTRSGPAALWRPRPEALRVRSALARLPVPGLLLCAMLRSRTLVPAEGGTHEVVVPRHISRVDLYAPCSDTDLALAHPQGLTVHHDPVEDVYRAVDATGAVLVRISGFRGVVLPRAAAAGRPRP